MSESDGLVSGAPTLTVTRYKADLLLVGGLLVAATAARLPYLNLIPVITDEAFEALAALSITQGDWILFGPINPTTGPLVAYLLALCFWLFGPKVYLARLFTMVLGALTVGLTYALARSLAQRRLSSADRRKAGLIAGALLAFSPVHIIVNSHVAWSNATTPFFMTLTLWTLHVALRRERGGLLVLAGFLYGLALQSHISMVAVAPGLVVWFLARRDVLAWLRRPWPYLAVGAALLGYGNMIVYNVISGGGLWTDVEKHTYAWELSPTLASYGQNLQTMVGAVAHTLGGQLPRLHDPLGSVVAVLLLTWLAASLVYATRRGETLPLLVLLSTALIMPYVNKRYLGLLSQRYTAFLLPLCYAAMGLGAARALALWRERRWPLARLVTVGGLVLALLLALYPVRAAFAHYAVETRAGRDNRLSLDMTAWLQESLPPGTPLYLSANLQGVRADGGYRYLRALYYFLTLGGVEHRVLDFPDLAARLEAAPDQEAWLLLPAGDYEALAQEFPLERIEGAPPVHNEGYLVRYAPAH